MGSGKSSVGREIAGRCELRFLDTDSIIRHNYRKSIADIFASIGEPVFRDEENRVLQDLQNSRDVVLATGGGIVLQTRNHLLLRSLGVVVWLTANEEVTWDRVSQESISPFVADRGSAGDDSQSDVCALPIVPLGRRYHPGDVWADTSRGRRSADCGYRCLVSRPQ